MLATYQNDIEQIVQSVFSTMLNIDLMRIDAPAPPNHEVLLATVHVAGEWTGTVVLALSPAVAVESAAAMLGDLETTAADREDVAAELVNMIGGNLKGLLPGPSFLSLPTIVTGNDFGQQVRDAQLLDELALAANSGLLGVRLYEKKMKLPDERP